MRPNPSCVETSEPATARAVAGIETSASNPVLTEAASVAAAPAGPVLNGDLESLLDALLAMAESE